MTSVVVHGAGGFVGGAIVRALAASGAFTPIACVRRPPRRPPPPYEVRVCDATDADAVRAASRGATHVVNAVLGNAATMRDATRNLCEATREAGGRMIHISTMSVYGAVEGVVAEDAPLNPAGVGTYGAAKIGCEGIVRRFSADGGDAVILRPGIVYGPGGEQWVGRTARLLRAGRLGDLGVLGDGFCNLIFCDDVGAAVVAALRKPDAAGAAINLAPSAPPPTWNEFLTALGRAIGATPIRRVTARRLRIESRLLAIPLQIAKRFADRLGLAPGVLPEPIPPSLLALFGQRIALAPNLADKLLGLSRTPMDTGVRACAAWFLERDQ